MKNKNSSSVVSKTIQVLDAFAQATNPLGVTELAELTGRNISTVYRIANELANHGYLRKAGKRGKYSLGFKFIKFTRTLNNTFQIKEIALPFMEKLSAMCGESCNLTLWMEIRWYISNISNAIILFVPLQH